MAHSQASCLCGQVTITAEDINPKFTVCHCESCRAWGGAPFFAVKCGTKVHIKGEENIKMYASSNWASRGFCMNCGTHLFFKFNASGEYNMPVGLFSDLAGLEMDMQYFSDMRPDYYCFLNETKTLTRAEIMAYFADHI
ncbi:GFA family protein [Photobacterium aphoticum]|uniref:Aldehyde-activating protein n=1 Tax=Photobacterium aphoticum TaxID=754436 RepID=A0A0J1JIZ0_9GAMM|nr:GFA family protein [Photobacterium aphoticum]KLV01982.1 aldehyde-activating protein [Photobacterium aphoticum]PSU60228.1 GFA family protein [Photobacterium aphoticum]GHA34202.1 aldehyde-activating protein [Photobacterium aphoticum]